MIDGLVVTEEGEIVETIPGAASLYNLAHMHYDADQQVKAWTKVKAAAAARLEDELREPTEFNGILARVIEGFYPKTDNDLLIDLLFEAYDDNAEREKALMEFVHAAKGFKRDDLTSEKAKVILDRATEYHPKKKYVTTSVVRKRLPQRSPSEELGAVNGNA